MKQAINLLFSQDSLKAIYRLFLEDSEVISQEELSTNQLEHAYQFLKKTLEDNVNNIFFTYKELDFLMGLAKSVTKFDTKKSCFNF